MEITWLKGLVSILAQTFKIFPKNPTFMTGITILILLFNSFISSIVLIFLKLITTSLEKITAQFDLNTFRSSLATIITYEIVIALILSLTSLFIATSTILASAITHGGKPIITVRTLFWRVIRSWKSPLLTWVYTTLFNIGYLCLVFVIAYLITLTLSLNPRMLSAVLFVLSLLGSILYLYIQVVLSLGLVVSVVEREIRGLEAIGKAAKIVKGMKLHGFVINLMFGVVGWVLFRCLVWAGFKMPAAGEVSTGMVLAGFGSPTAGQIVVGLVVLNGFCLIKMLWWMAYTVMFYEGMKRRGEEVVELVEEVEYTKVPIETMV
ncbi:hypothetical protein LINPERPRIM_LOCUS33814 [Linum perenne]